MTNTLQQKENTSTRKSVYVGLSGGVDSAVSAALLKEKGYEVTGVFIKIQIPGYPCPAAVDRLEAMRVAAHLRIPFIEIDLSREYEQEVFRPSIEEYRLGKTPNPDTLCNEKIKFGLFYAFARKSGADMVATGHYAETKDGNLYKSKDSEKDQTYFLWGVSKDKLHNTIFPVGTYTKKEVRLLAKKYDLPNADRKDSQGLCFLGDISIEDMLQREVAPKEGDVVDESGKVLGSHRGVEFYTLGQRHGYTLFVHTPELPPHYVVGKDLERNRLVVSSSKFPTSSVGVKIILMNTNWIGDIEEGACEARYRYRGELLAAELKKKNEGVEVVLNSPQHVPPGQSLVLYRGTRCLGGGVIQSATLI
jgi:tRNA-uridine 2-sulfurtransferase